MRVDAHLHVFARASVEFPREVKPSMPPEREAPVEDLLAHMADHAIDKAVLVQTGGTSLAHHAYLQHCLRNHPDCFEGIGLIPPDAPSVADHMDRLATDGQIIGFRLRSLGGPIDPLQPFDLRQTQTYPIWEHAARQDYVLWLYLQAVDAYALPFFLEAFSSVRVVVNHMMVCPGEGQFSWDAKGRPHIDVDMPPETRYSTLGLKIGRIPDNTRGRFPFANVCIHLSGQYAISKEAYPYLDLAEWHRNLYATFGPERLIWASDFPWIATDPGYGESVEVLDHLLPELSADERRQIMGETARRFLRLGA
jgi:L-fuconolactonase